VSDNKSTRNASMIVGIVWARACLNIVGLVGRQGGRSDMYL
jgi:hypothetical protein